MPRRTAARYRELPCCALRLAAHPRQSRADPATCLGGVDRDGLAQPLLEVLRGPMGLEADPQEHPAAVAQLPTVVRLCAREHTQVPGRGLGATVRAVRGGGVRLDAQLLERSRELVPIERLAQTPLDAKSSDRGARVVRRG